MHAIEVASSSDHALRWHETSDPRPQPDEVLVRVRAAGVNRADLLQRKGLYPPPAGSSEILGLEAAGEIVQVGRDVTRWRIGQHVCALLPGGGYAERVVAHQDVLLEKPEKLSFVQAAALPEVLYTAFLNLLLEGELQAGQTALIHAGASGVGTAAIQLCKAFDARVFATASAAKLERLLELGADAAIDRHAEDFAERVAELTEGRGVDVILDPVGGAYLERNLKALATGGRLVLIGLMGGARAELPLDQLLLRRRRILGSVLRSRSVREKAAITEQMRQRVWPLVESGAVRPLIDRVLPIQQADQAHALMASNQTFGKIVLNVP